MYVHVCTGVVPRRPMYLLGYIPAHNRLYLGDREQTIVSFSLQLAVLEYQTAIMRQDFATADSILPRVPADQRTRVAHFLEKQGFMKQALVVSTDSDHRWGWEWGWEWGWGAHLWEGDGWHDVDLSLLWQV